MDAIQAQWDAEGYDVRAEFLREGRYVPPLLPDPPGTGDEEAVHY